MSKEVKPKFMFTQGARRIYISEWVAMMVGQLRAFEEDQIDERQETESDHLKTYASAWEDRFTDWRIGI